MVNVRLSGFTELMDRLKKASATIQKEVDAELGITANEMRGGAVKDAPADQGIIRAELIVEHRGINDWKVASNAIYSGYQEFGTKNKVAIPSGLENIAAQLKGGHVSSLKAREAIYAWCKRKGIEKKFWWPIFIKIITTGIKPHPFFFKQLDAFQPQLIKRVEAILKSV